MRYKKESAVILIVCLLFGLFVYKYHSQRVDDIYSDTVEKIANEALTQLEFTARESENLRYQMKSVVNLLSHSDMLLDYAKSFDTIKQDQLETHWKAIAHNQKWFTQIRFLDLNGMEKIRINYAVKNDIASAASELQDKSHRSYFKLAQNLALNEIIATEIDLEVEYGEFVYPYMPSLRLITPVSQNGIKVGFLITNIDVWYIADRLNYSTDNIFNLELLDEGGYFLSSNNKEKLFGRILEQRRQYNLAKQHPRVWAFMQEQVNGYTYENSDLFVFNRVEFKGEERLYLMVKIEPHQIKQQMIHQLKALEQQITFVIVLILLFTMPSIFFALYTRRRSMESKLAQAALNGMSAVMISDLSHRTLMVNQAFESITGYQANQIEGKEALKFIFRHTESDIVATIWNDLSKDHVWEGEVECITQLGHPFVALMRIRGVLAHLNKVSYYITSIVDITERKELEDKFRDLSERDALTHLWNRRKFDETMDHYTALAHYCPDNNKAHLALIDIDHFKSINDQYGHDEGDRVIKAVASLLDSNVRGSDFVARIGGEEFAIVMPHIDSNKVEVLLNRLRKRIEYSSAAPVTVSVGCCRFRLDSNETYKKADLALYESKTSGRNTVTLYD